MITDNDLRGRIECFIPWESVRRELCALGRVYLPDEAWLPHLLAHGAIENILDFWAELPQYAGRLEFCEEELRALFCAMADPPRYGTADGRYPQQLEMLSQHLSHPASLLDLGCGIGLGTLEIANKFGIRDVLGVTTEPLEVWMAKHRILPHDPQRSQHFARYASQPADFVCADATSFIPPRKYSLVICNGLAGGRFMHSPEALRHFIANWDKYLTDDGIIALANAFHTGHRPGVELLIKLAQEAGWYTAGNWQNLVCKRR
jgi:SAM-dependent methyltransferase